MNRLAIMQGRLSPPRDGEMQAFPVGWWKEFARARDAGIECIEWLYRGNDNPLDATTALDEIRLWASHQGVRVRSICADYFVDHPLIVGGRVVPAECARLLELLQRAAVLNVVYVVLPFVGRIAGAGAGDVQGSRLMGKDDVAALIGLLLGLRATLQRLDVRLCLESDLPPRQLRAILSAVDDHPKVRVCYDTGDRAALGYDPQYDLGVLGDVVGAVHLKDRLLGGATVPMGQGVVDFAGCRDALQQANYQGSLVLQFARGVAGDEVEWARRNVDAVRAVWGAGAACPITSP